MAVENCQLGQNVIETLLSAMVLFRLEDKFSENRKLNFLISFSDLKLKNKFQKILSFFDVGYDIEKTKKKSKFVLFLNQKKNYTFGTRIQPQQEFFLILVIGIIYGTTVILS